MAFPADAETVRRTRPCAVRDRQALDGTRWLRLYRAVAERDEVKLARLLEEAEEAFLTAVRAGEISLSTRWSAWYINHIVGGAA